MDLKFELTCIVDRMLIYCKFLITHVASQVRIKTKIPLMCALFAFMVVWRNSDYKSYRFGDISLQTFLLFRKAKLCWIFDLLHFIDFLGTMLTKLYIF